MEPTAEDGGGTGQWLRKHSRPAIPAEAGSPIGAVLSVIIAEVKSTFYSSVIDNPSNGIVNGV